MRPAGDDEVITNHAMPDAYRCLFVAVDAAVGQAGRAADVAIVTDAHIADGTGIEDGDMMADTTCG